MQPSIIQIRIITLLLFISTVATGQGIKGRLTDSQKNPVPFAAIYDETTYIGTTSNSEGYYDLKLPAGKHSLIYKSLGYFMERRMVTTSTATLTIDIQLSEQAYELKDVIVRPGKEDPAYAIMRKAISMAPYFLNQVKQYSADVYMRGTIHIINMPKFIANHTEINGKKGLIKSGDVYIEESLNQIKFHAPDKYDQKVKSFRTTFPGENNVSPMEIVKASFYQPKMEMVISPLAPNAFNYYKFQYQGFSTEGENTIFKIKVIPKHNSQQLLNGYIFIIDNLWCLHSADVYEEMFFGKLHYKEIFSPVKGNAWLPISYLFSVNASIVGVKADYQYTSSVKYQDVSLNEKNVIKPVRETASSNVPEKPAEQKVNAKKQKNQEEMARLISKEKLTNREMVKLANIMAKEAPQDTVKKKSMEIKDENVKVEIEKDAMKKDTGYWNNIRPIPLTTVESGITLKKDSASRSAKDSLAATDTSKIKKHKSTALQKFALGDLSFFALDSALQFKYKGLVGPNKFDFNTVDGFIYKQNIELDLKTDSVHHLHLNTGAGYAFSRKAIPWWVNVNYPYAPMKRGNFVIYFGNNTCDFNRQGGMNSYLNALTSLFFRYNYVKYYQQQYFALNNNIDIANGFVLNTTAGYRSMITQTNHSDFSFFYRNKRDYTSNLPVQDPEALAKNVNNKETYFDIKLEYTPEYFYRVWGGKKHYQYSKFPTFFLGYRKAMPGIAGSNADFDYLEGGIKQIRNWGMMHSFSYKIISGGFLSQKKIFLSDYKFFNNQPLPLVFGDMRSSFALPSLYENFTNAGFVEGHVTFSTPYLLFKYLPFISNKLWLENLHLNYLYTRANGHYWEAGYTLSQIYMVGSIGVYTGFNGTNFQSVGLKIGLGLGM